MTTLLDTNILVRHFTGDSPELSSRATAFIRSAAVGDLLLLDLVVGELVFVLQRVYRQERGAIARTLRSTLALEAIRCEHEARVNRAIELYESGAAWTDAYLTATAEQRGIPAIASFDRGMPRVPDVQRIEPPAV